MIGLIVAEKEEVGNLVKSLKSKIIEFNGIRYYIGNIANKQVILCFCGIGKANAAATAMNMITNFGVDQIFNIGLCGSCKTTIKPGMLLIADNCEYCDVDVTPLDYALNQIPNEPSKFSIKSSYVNFLKSLDSDSTIGTIATSDSFVTIQNIELFPSLANKDVIGFDMEACAIAQVCHKTKTDFLCAKVVSDNLAMDANSKKQYHTNYQMLSKKIEGITKKVLEYYSK